MTNATTVTERQNDGAVSVASASGDSVTVSPSALRRISRILSDEAEGTMLRISVEGGGCSGFQYKYDLVTDREADDFIVEDAGATVIVDPVSLQYMSGSVVDYVDDIMGQSFQINNPLASAGCGCGTSFSI
ncbi:iron-sulfur cluster assembly accessory protein [Stappia sp. ES.058]|uniref:HesB/IscA family protein n=1 Tax=Stappia sp. ES.058 TaxID=1881061 RepID=UPI00087C8834|nr:iron-sulfur cluster assembly accessory protein [Stappia sp. ES.058]SDU12602.1 Iron-sulfur cluster assembly accessory protein [Stappia sp. ES.058]